MIYYKVPEKMDQKRTANGTIFVKNELLTKKQLDKMGGNPEQFEKVEISQRKIYWFFGARFAMND
jgi:hypothetical protein